MRLRRKPARDGVLKSRYALGGSNLFKSKYRYFAATSLATALIFLVPGAACAQAENVDDTIDQSKRLGTVTVTAQKKEESSQDVPVTLTAFSGEMIEDANIVAVEDLTRFTPGLNIVQSDPARTRIRIRGVGSRKFDIGSDPSVGVFIDEVYIPRFSGQEFSLLDVERIEVLKGPQGTLFGRNTPGGAISIVSKDPSDTFEGYVEAGIGNRDSYSFKGRVSGPLSKTVSASLNYGEETQGGYIENTLTGNTNDVTSRAGRAKFVFEPDSTLSVVASIQFTDLNADGIMGSSAPTLPNNQAVPLLIFPPGSTVTVDPDGYHATQNIDGSMDIESVMPILRVQKDFGAFTVTSISAYRDGELYSIEDFDRTSADVGIATTEEESTTFSQELRVSNDNFIGGLFYYKDDAFRRDGFNWRSASLPYALAGGTIATDGTVVDLETESWAIFGQYEFALTDRLSLTLGGRYTEDSKVYTLSGETTAPGVPLVAVPYVTSGELSFDSFDPKVSLEYRATEDVLLFASYNQGFKSGGVQFTASRQALAEQVFEPEDIDAYEIGIKSDLLNKTLRFNASAYMYDYSNLQQQRVEVIDGSPSAVTRNAAQAEIKGLELDATWVATEELLFRVGYNYLDAKFGEFISTGGVDLSGNSMPNSPENTLSATIDYQTELSNAWRFGIGADWFWTGSQNYDVFEDDPYTMQDGYNTGQLRMSLDSPTDRIKISVFADNVTDQKYARILLRRQTEVLTNTADGVRYGARVRFNF